MDPASLNPYTAIPPSVVDSAEHRALALRAARQSVVLLTNQANSLPLSLKPRVVAAIPSAASGEHSWTRSAAAESSMAVAGATSSSLLASASEPMKVAVVGPNANVTAFGNYNGNNRNASTIYEGILRYVPHASYAQGCSVATNDTSGIAGAIATASMVDVVVAVLGIDQSQEHETGTRTDVVLPGVQPKLLEALVATGKPVIVVLMGGSAMAVQYAAKHAAAMLWVGCVNQLLDKA
jgi:beta-glucosidase-like glycosyl hydrolase